MKKAVIGILPTSSLFIGDSHYDDYYKFINLYPKRIYECDAIPIGLLMDDGKLDYSSLELCDGFLIPGGNKVNKYVYEIIYYAIKNNKPVLGICLGSQAIAIFSTIYELMDKNKDYNINEIIKIYELLKEKNDGTLLKKLPQNNIHDHSDCTRENINNCRHQIDIKNGSILKTIYNSDNANVVSLHSYDYKYVGGDFIVSAVASDGVAEGIEYKDKNCFILGVHFHPENDDDNLIIKRLVMESSNRTHN